MPAAADALIVENLDWCRAVAMSTLKGLPLCVERDDVIQDACMGLIKAARAFDPARGVPFRSFALIRIRGEIADRRRDADPLTRGERRALKKAQAKGLEMTEPFRALYAKSGELLRIDENVDASGGVHALEDPGAEGAFSEIIARDLRRRLRAREQVIVGLTGEGYGLREIGQALELTESRACQLRTRAYRQLAQMVA